MKIRSLNFDDAEDLDEVVAVLTADEAAYIAVLLGGMNHIKAEEVMPGGAQAQSSIYEALTGAVFNRLYDDGVRDYLAERS